jgi:hypothetical protein
MEKIAMSDRLSGFELLEIILLSAIVSPLVGRLLVIKVISYGKA